MRLRCIFHDGETDETLSIDLKTGKWQCFARCGGGNWMEFVERVKLSGDYAPIEEAQAEERQEQEPILKSFLERGITREMCAKWGIVWDESRKAMKFPVFQPDGSVTALWRMPDGVSPKYRYPAGFDRSGNLYGFWNITDLKRVVLVEGPLDAVWAQEAGVPAAAILGSSLTDRQADILANNSVHRVTLCFDADEAGRLAAERAIPTLRQRGMWVYQAKLPKGVKDIQEVPLEQVANIAEGSELSGNIVGQRLERWL